MPFDLSPDDARAIEQTLGRFLDEVVSPAVERPETPLPPRQLAAMTEGARELGLLNLDAEEGIGLWDSPGQSEACALTLRCLRKTAQRNAGIALHFHQLALGAWLGRRLDMCDGSPTACGLLGGYGMGRHLLPRLLRGGELSAEEHAWLAAYFEPAEDCPRLLQLGIPTEHVLLARHDAARGSLTFERFACSDLSWERHDTSHGMDETSTFALTDLPTPPGQATPPVGDPSEAAATYAAALELDSLGLCAISVGAQAHCRDRAAEYAELRVQGGTEIIHHPAVKELLGRSQTALAAGDAALGGLSMHALSEGSPAVSPGSSLARSLSTRAGLLPEGCEASNAALQVFGGSGYIRDNGLEKLVRDQNHLRVFWGTPGDLRRFVAELERAP